MSGLTTYSDLLLYSILRKYKICNSESELNFDHHHVPHASDFCSLIYDNSPAVTELSDSDRVVV